MASTKKLRCSGHRPSPRTCLMPKKADTMVSPPNHDMLVVRTTNNNGAGWLLGGNSRGRTRTDGTGIIRMMRLICREGWTDTCDHDGAMILGMLPYADHLYRGRHRGHCCRCPAPPPMPIGTPANNQKQQGQRPFLPSR